VAILEEVNNGKRTKKVFKGLKKASKTHAKQAKIVKKHIKKMQKKIIMFRRQFRSGSKSPAWQRKEGKSKSGGLNRKGIASYRAANPGSKLSMAVTTKPSKLKKGSKAANRRKSFLRSYEGHEKTIDIS
jgi:hypothetical protein